MSDFDKWWMMHPIIAPLPKGFIPEDTSHKEAEEWMHKATDEINRLHEATPLWQTIETAPKSKWVLVYYPDFPPAHRVKTLRLMHEIWLGKLQWSWCDISGRCKTPKFWMQIPEPPKGDT